MSTFTSEPGTRLGGRYRLEDRLAAGSGWAAWKALDEILARPVTVLMFAPGFPRIRETVTAARAASRLTDARLTQVFDVEDSWDQAYVVLEWVGGDSLSDLLADGPLDPARGAELVVEAAEALATAHGAGLAHLCLNPGSLRWTPGGGVKVVGLGIDAALSAASADDPPAADTEGLARLLYATVTGCWPGGEWPGMPRAPESEGRPRSPRQVSAGVPDAIDKVVREALLDDIASLTTPAEFAGALAEAAPPPGPPPPAHQSFGGGDWAAASGDPGPAGPSDPAATQRVWGGGGRRRRRAPGAKAMVSVVAVVALGAAATVAWNLGGRHPGQRPTAGATPSQSGPSSSPLSRTAAAVLTPVSASGFDPLSSAKADPGNENSQRAKYAIDGNPHTYWETQFYRGSPLFGHLKAGSGLILSMGKRVRLSSVTVRFGPTPGADVSVELGNSDVRSPATLKHFTTVAQGTNLSGTHTFRVRSKASGSYVLIWFTKLPPEASGPADNYQAEIFNVALRGSG